MLFSPQQMFVPICYLSLLCINSCPLIAQSITLEGTHQFNNESKSNPSDACGTPAKPKTPRKGPPQGSSRCCYALDCHQACEPQKKNDCGCSTVESPESKKPEVRSGEYKIISIDRSSVQPGDTVVITLVSPDKTTIPRLFLGTMEIPANRIEKIGLDSGETGANETEQKFRITLPDFDPQAKQPDAPLPAGVYQIKLAPGSSPFSDAASALIRVRDEYGPKIIWASLGVTLFLVWILLVLSHTGASNPSRENSWRGRWMVDPDTKSYSLNRIQFLAWTFAGVLSFFYLLFSRVWAQKMHELPALPNSLLGILAISASTSIVSQGIKSARGSEGGGSEKPFLRDLVSSGGIVVPEKIQFLLWTIIGVVSFIFVVLAHEPTAIKELPEIPPQILLLSGLSSVGYLGGKFVRGPGPVIEEVSAINSNEIVDFEIRGRNLSSQAVLSIDNEEIPFRAIVDESGKEGAPQILKREPKSSDLNFAQVLKLRIDIKKIPTKLVKLLQPDPSEKRVLIVRNPDGQSSEKSVVIS